MRETLFPLLLLALPIQDPKEPAGKIEELVDRAFATGDFPSLAVGVVRGEDLVFARALGVADREGGRSAKPDTIYPIGSITKVFTTTLLAILRDEGVVRLDDPIRRWLPEDVKLPADPRGDPAITLRHLATHTSGLPRIPRNLEGKPGDPYNGYSLEHLFEGLRQTNLGSPIGAEVSYSNLGVGLLGRLLERAAGNPYETLLREKILEPLGMEDTGIALTPPQSERLATGYLHDDPAKEAVPWDLGALAPAGGLASTVPDLAKFLSFQFRAGEAVAGPVSGGTLAELHRPQRVLPDWKRGIGLGWMVEREEWGVAVWHNGGLSGHRSHLRFSPSHEVGVVVLSNRGWGEGRNEVDGLARELLREAVALHGAVSPAVRAMAEAVGDHIREEPGETLAGLFHPKFLEAIPIEKVDAVFRELYERGGKCAGIESILPTELESGARVTFRMERGEPVACELQIQPGDPPKLLYLEFE